MNPWEAPGFLPARTQIPRPPPYEGRQAPNRRKQSRGPRHSTHRHLSCRGAASNPAPLSRDCGISRRIQTPATSYWLNMVPRALCVSRALSAPFRTSEQNCLRRKQNAVGSVVETHSRCRHTHTVTLCRAGLGTPDHGAGRTMSDFRRHFRVLHSRSSLQAGGGHPSPVQPSYAERRCQRPHTQSST